MAEKIEIVKETPILNDQQRIQSDKDAAHYLGLMIRCHNQKLLLNAHRYAYNPHLSYREKLALADRVMFSAWKGLCQAGFPHIANGIAKLGSKP